MSGPPPGYPTSTSPSDYPPPGYPAYYPPSKHDGKMTTDPSQEKYGYTYGTPVYGAQPAYPGGGPYGAPPQGYGYGGQPQYYGGGQPVYVQQHSSPQGDLAGGLCGACLAALCCCCLVRNSPPCISGDRDL